MTRIGSKLVAGRGAGLPPRKTRSGNRVALARGERGGMATNGGTDGEKEGTEGAREVGREVGVRGREGVPNRMDVGGRDTAEGSQEGPFSED